MAENPAPLLWESWIEEVIREKFKRWGWATIDIKLCEDMKGNRFFDPVFLAESNGWSFHAGALSWHFDSPTRLERVNRAEWTQGKLTGKPKRRRR